MSLAGSPASSIALRVRLIQRSLAGDRPVARDGPFPRKPAVRGDAEPGIDEHADLRVQEISEAELVALLRARVPAAWEYLYEEHYDRVFRYALVRLNNRERAEDVAAGTYHRALAGIGKFSFSGRPVLAWLYGIARNIVREEFRNIQRGKSARPLDPARGRNQNGVAPAADDIQAGDEDRLVELIDLSEALKELTDLQREVVILRCFSGLSAAETARIVGRPESAVYALQARALEGLRRRML